MNYLAVLAAAVVYFFIGFLWYSVLFKKPWSEMMGHSKLSKKERDARMKGMGLSLILNFAANLVAAYGLAYAVYEGGTSFHIAGLSLGLNTGFWIWLSYLATSQLNSFLWDAKPFKLYLINVSYYLVSFLAMGTILALWQ
jgi:hypothetical protein